MNKKIIILIIMITIGCLVTIGNVSASTTTTYKFSDYIEDTGWASENYPYEYNGKRYSEPVQKIVNNTNLIKTDTKIIKKNNIKYKRTVKTYKTNISKYVWDTNKDIYGNPITGWSELSTYKKTFNKYIDFRVKKGMILKKTTPKYDKTVESKGKVYKYYKYTKTIALNNKKYKAIKTTTKKLFGYYKVFNMPNFKSGDYDWKSFKDNWFTIGNSKIGYYINHLYDEEEYNPEHRVYKVSPKTVNIFGSLFFHKKPYSFKVYVKA